MSGRISSCIRKARCLNPNCRTKYLCELDDGVVVTFPEHLSTGEPVFEERIIYYNQSDLNICTICYSEVELTKYISPKNRR